MESTPKADVVFSDLQTLILLGKDWLKVDDINHLYGISPTRIEGLRKAREISYTRVGNGYLYNHADLKAYFARNKRMSQAEMESKVASYQMKENARVKHFR